ncbi:MAG: hypothetical protein V3T60_02155, partial [Candidatus Binatia bacterium]
MARKSGHFSRYGGTHSQRPDSEVDGQPFRLVAIVAEAAFLHTPSRKNFGSGLATLSPKLKTVSVELC